MAKYKDEHGTTKLGDFIRSLGKSDLIGKAFSVAGSITGIPFLNSLHDLIQGDSTLPDEVKKQALEFYKIDIDAQIENSRQITSRWQTDMSSDSWLSKNARPIVLFFSWFLILILIVADYFGAPPVPTNYVDMLEMLFLTINGAYFGDRAVRGGIAAFKK